MMDPFRANPFDPYRLEENFLAIKYNSFISISSSFTNNIITTYPIIMHTSFQSLVYNLVTLGKFQRERGAFYNLTLMDNCQTILSRLYPTYPVIVQYFSTFLWEEGLELLRFNPKLDESVILPSLMGLNSLAGEEHF